MTPLPSPRPQLHELQRPGVFFRVLLCCASFVFVYVHEKTIERKHNARVQNARKLETSEQDRFWVKVNRNESGLSRRTVRIETPKPRRVIGNDTAAVISPNAFEHYHRECTQCDGFVSIDAGSAHTGHYVLSESYTYRAFFLVGSPPKKDKTVIPSFSMQHAGPERSSQSKPNFDSLERAVVNRIRPN